MPPGAFVSVPSIPLYRICQTLLQSFLSLGCRLPGTDLQEDAPGLRSEWGCPLPAFLWLLPTTFISASWVGPGELPPRQLLG